MNARPRRQTCGGDIVHLAIGPCHPREFLRSPWDVQVGRLKEQLEEHLKEVSAPGSDGFEGFPNSKKQHNKFILIGNHSI